MTDQHPITPPPELRRLWAQQAQRMDPHDPVAWLEHVANKAARWGADQELEACCEWLEKGPYGFTITASAPHMISDLREARRPKPPSLAEEALTKINAILSDPRKSTLKDEIEALELSRRALERLKELEKGNE